MSRNSVLVSASKRVLSNRVFQFIGSRYLTYFLQFINSLLVAVYLGPFYLGVWGFLLLVTQYLNQFNFGISHSANAIISINKRRDWYVQILIGNALSMLCILTITLIVIFLISYLCGFKFGEKYNFFLFAPYVVFIGALSYFNVFFSNVFRVYGRLYEIAFQQTVFPVLTLVLALFFKKEDLLWALILGNCFAVFLSLGLYVLRSPVKLKLLFVWRLIKKIQIKGWHLFIYSISFYLIIITTRSFVSAFYSVEEFGYFSFSFSLSNAILLLFQAFSFLIFPKLINRFATSSNQRIAEILVSVRDTYITLSHGLTHLAIMVFPYLLVFFPDYRHTFVSFQVIALSVVLYTNSFGYQGLLIAKGKEMQLGVISFISLVVNVSVACFLIMVMKVLYYQVVLATLISYLLYIFLVCYYGRKSINASLSLFPVVKDIFTWKVFVPFFVSIGFSFFQLNPFWAFIPFALYLGLNYRVLGVFRNLSKRIVNDPKFINI